MAEQFFATKGNLMTAKHTLKLCKLGYELLDQKKNVLVRELKLLFDRYKKHKNQMMDLYIDAYKQLEEANITMGIISKIADGVPEEKGLQIAFRSVMGVELPMMELEQQEKRLPYGLYLTNTQVDEVYLAFTTLKEHMVETIELENGMLKLCEQIKKTSKRENALKNVMIPKYEQAVKSISLTLEEKERESFSRLKIMKKNQ